MSLLRIHYSIIKYYTECQKMFEMWKVHKPPRKNLIPRKTIPLSTEHSIFIVLKKPK